MRSILFQRTLRHPLCSALSTFVVLAVIPTALAAHKASAQKDTWAPGHLMAPSADEVTQTLLTLNTQYQGASPAQRSKQLDNLVAVARIREQLLASLIADEPATVLRAALSESTRASLPAAAQAYIEKDTEVEGTLEALVEDRTTDSTVHYHLNANGGERLSLHFAAEPPTALPTGSRIRVRGIQVENTLALGSTGTSVQTLSVALPNTFGAQKTIVILVNFQDLATQPCTVASAQSVVFTTTSNFYWEASYQQTWLTGDVAGWFTIPMSSTVCDYTTLAAYAKSAATAAGLSLSAYNHYVYAFPSNACTWSGLGTVGGNPSEAWINGNLQLGVAGHELGHNLGLYHSHGLDCGSTTLGSSCTVVEYGDTGDVMGAAPGHFNAFQKERLGWLNYGTSPPVTTVQSNGTYVIDPYESMTSNPKALKILKSTDPVNGANTWYYVEYRQALGFDSFFSGNTNVRYGVVIHTGSESDGNTSDLLDLTPQTTSWSDPALDIGQTFYDLDAGVAITAQSATSTGASVSVALGAVGPVTCVHTNPTVALWPATQTVLPGMTVSYTVSVTNIDNSNNCSASTFTVQVAAPTGFTATLASPSLSVSPGESASTTLQVTSAPSVLAGSYTIGVTVVNGSASTFTSSTSATYVVVSSAPAATATPTPTSQPQYTPTSTPPPTFTPASTLAPSLTATPTPSWTRTPTLPPTPMPTSISESVRTDRATYNRSQSVTISATVSAGGSPASGASVTFTITKSNGMVVTASATTSGTGVATYKMRLQKLDPTGTYQVRADATWHSMSGSATTSFAVQ